MILQTKQKIFLASLAYRVVRFTRKAMGKELKGKFRRGSFLWELDLREVIDFMIYISGSFENDLKRFIQKNVTEGDIVIDIGANIGAHTLTLGRSVEAQGKAYAIEATEYAFNKLQTNINLNPDISNQTRAFHCVLEAKESPKTEAENRIEIHSSWPLLSSEERHPSHQGILKPLGNAQHMTLDQFVESQEITRIDLIKIDVDGNEWDVLSGGIKTFEKMRPIILMELAPDYNEAGDEKEFLNIHRLLKTLNYQFYDFTGTKLTENGEELAASIPAGASQNVVIVPNASRKIHYN